MLEEVGRDVYELAEQWRAGALQDFGAAPHEGPLGIVDFFAHNGTLVRALALALNLMGERFLIEQSRPPAGGERLPPDARRVCFAMRRKPCVRRLLLRPRRVGLGYDRPRCEEE